MNAEVLGHFLVALVPLVQKPSDKSMDKHKNQSLEHAIPTPHSRFVHENLSQRLSTLARCLLAQRLCRVGRGAYFYFFIFLQTIAPACRLLHIYMIHGTNASSLSPASLAWCSGECMSIMRGFRKESHKKCFVAIQRHVFVPPR